MSGAMPPMLASVIVGKSGDYVHLGHTSNGNLTLAASGKRYYIPWVVPVTQSFAGFSVYLVTAAGTTGTVRLGVHNSDPTTGRPSSVLFDASTASLIGATGQKEAVSAQTMTPGFYYQTLQFEYTGSAPVVAGFGVLQATFLAQMGTSSAAVSNERVCLVETSKTGALDAAGTAAFDSFNAQTPFFFARVT